MVNTAAEVETCLSARLGEIGERFTRELEQGQAPDIEAYLTADADLSHVLRPLLTALTEIGAVGIDQLAGGLTKGKTLGDFRIVREVGRGGMGIVFEAEQVSMGRMVALKVLPFASMIDPQPLERFRNEVRAVGTLQHPHIVSVYSVGEERSVHYYAMQLVRGQSLAAVIRELQSIRNANVVLSGSSISDIIASSDSNHNDSTDPTRSDDGSRKDSAWQSKQETRAAVDSGTIKSATDRNYFCNVARIGIQAAEALAHAHEFGIIHRDIKPGNLMLDAHGQLFVTDFGLARIEAAGVTMTGDWMGTPRYMSPEQALGKKIVIDHRIDIYSLGVTLYEMLTLKPAFDAKDRQALLRQIANDEPIRPRSIDSHIPRELETIVLKAISKNRDDRYDTASDLADDLQCFLENQPINARPPTLVQRGTKWAVRHKPLVATAAVVLILAGIGLAISNFLIAGERNIARHERDEAQRQEKRADENFRRAQDAVDQYLTNISENELLNASSLQPLRKDLLELALTYYQQFIEQREDDPKLQSELAAAYFRVGKITKEIGSASQSLEQHLKALRILEHLKERFPDELKYGYDLALSHLNVAHLLRIKGDYDKANVMYKQAVASFRNLVSKKPNVPWYRSSLAEALSCLAWLQSDMNEFAEAITCGQESVQILEKLAAENPEEHQFDLSDSLFRLSHIQQVLGDFEAAMSSLMEAVRVGRLVAGRRPDLPDNRDLLASHLRSLALLENRVGSWEEAIALVNEAVEIQSELVNKNPKVARYKVTLADLYDELSKIQSGQGKLDDALKNIRASQGFRKQLAAGNPKVPDYQQRLAWSYMVLAKILDATERSDEAMQSRKEATRLLTDLFKKHSKIVRYQHSLAGTYSNRAMALSRTGNISEARELYLQAISISEAIVATHPNPSYQRFLGIHYGNLAELCGEMGNLPDALRFGGIALDIRKRLAADNASNLEYRDLLANSYSILGQIQQSAGSLDQSQGSLEQAVQIWTRLEKEHPKYVNGLRLQCWLAETYWELGRLQYETDDHTGATNSSTKALELMNELMATNPSDSAAASSFAYFLATCPLDEVCDHSRAVELATLAAEKLPTVLSVQSNLGIARYRAGQFEAAIEPLTKYAEVLDDAETLFFLSMAYHKIGDRAEAQANFETAVKWMNDHNIQNPILKRLQTEAAELLGMDQGDTSSASAEGNPAKAELIP